MEVLVRPTYDPTVRGLCAKPYPLHPKGCPNFGKKTGCPPKAPRLCDVFYLGLPCFVIVNRFDLGAHVAKMREAHPGWSKRQLECCLYWQGTARRHLEGMIVRFELMHPTYLVERCPEAMGLNVTETLRRHHVDIEWPPVTVATQVAFAGVPRKD